MVSEETRFLPKDVYCFFGEEIRIRSNSGEVLDHIRSVYRRFFSGRHGENFYFISGAEAKRRELRLLLTPRSRLSEEVSTEHSEQGDEQIIVITPGMTGVVVIRAPLRGPSFAADTLDALQHARCETVPALDPNAMGADEHLSPGEPPLPVRRPATRWQ